MAEVIITERQWRELDDAIHGIPPRTYGDELRDFIDTLSFSNITSSARRWALRTGVVAAVSLFIVVSGVSPFSRGSVAEQPERPVPGVVAPLTATLEPTSPATIVTRVLPSRIPTQTQTETVVPIATPSRTASVRPSSSPTRPLGTATLTPIIPREFTVVIPTSAVNTQVVERR
jgi:hypothetical protein